MAAETNSTIALLYQVSRELASALDLKLVLQRMLFSAINNVGGERGSIIVLDDNGKAVESAIVYGNQVRESNTIQFKETVERGLAGWVIRNRQAALVTDTRSDERWLTRADDLRENSAGKSVLCVPLLAREALVGVLTLVHPTPNTYTQDNLELMQAIADQASLSVLNARLYAESQRQARVMTALAESAVNINASLRMDEVIERILQQTRQALQAETACLGLAYNASEVVFSASGLNANFWHGQRAGAGEGIAGRVLRDGRGVIAPRINGRMSLSSVEQAGGSTRALACAPIHAQGRVIGVLQAVNPINGAFDPDSLLVLTGLGSLAGSVIQNAQLFERLDSARRRYHDLFEDSIDPIVITDLHGRIQEANHQAVLFSGYSASQLRQLLIEQLHEVNFEKTGRSFENIQASALTYESALYDSQKNPLPAQVYARRVNFDEQESVQWILRDISERKDLDALREDLAAMIYHDLRSPLANILSSVEMLKTSIPASEQENAQPIFRIAQNSIDRIQRLVNSLLDINRLEQNHPVGEKQPVEPLRLLEEARQAALPGAEGRNQRLIISAPASLPPLSIDVDMIRRVLINLTENAIKYSPNNTEIELGASLQAGQIHFWVEDNGPGIAPGDRERIFEKFTRLKTKSRASGLGVGLAFCKLAIQGHGGKIWVEDKQPQGSRFVFDLPLEIK